MKTECPNCHTELLRTVEMQRHCPSCARDYKLHVACNKCGSELERLKACGAVSFWCHPCNELKSKSSAIYTLQEINK